MEILSHLARKGLRLHGFGMKTGALHQGATEFLASADSLAWSLRARFAPPLPGCTHQRCSSCERFAVRWLHNIERELHRSATKVGVSRAHRLGLDLGRPRCDLPPLSRVRKLLKRGASITEITAALSCSAWTARQAITRVLPRTPRDGHRSRAVDGHQEGAGVGAGGRWPSQGRLGREGLLGGILGVDERAWETMARSMRRRFLAAARRRA